ncbi:MAG: SprT family zinc-dependent metalloprotease [Saprospiraceae bacterium]
MSTKTTTISVNGQEVLIVRKDIKNMHLAVYPPEGKIRVAAPHAIDDETIRLAVISRLGWIRKQQKNFENQERQSLREMVSGESHYFAGRRYRLKVLEKAGRSSVRIIGTSFIELTVPPGTDRDTRERILERWYRRQLRRLIPGLLAKWEPIIGVQVKEVQIKKMKTRWGTCNIEAGRIWLNLELMKKPSQCLEYILVHELVHLLERHHNDRFIGLMDKFLPPWRTLRSQLNKAPLAHSDWKY